MPLRMEHKKFSDDSSSYNSYNSYTQIIHELGWYVLTQKYKSHTKKAAFKVALNYFLSLHFY